MHDSKRTAHFPPAATISALSANADMHDAAHLMPQRGNPIHEHAQQAIVFASWFSELLVAPRRGDLLINLGAWCRRMGWAEYAELFYARALEVDEGDLVPAIHNNLGNLFVDQRRYQCAQTQYELALRREPAFLPAHRGLCEVGLATRDNTLAEEHLALLESANAVPFPQRAFLRGRLENLKGNRPAAREWLRSAVRQAPNQPVFWGTFVEVLDSGHSTTMADEVLSFRNGQSARLIDIAGAALASMIKARRWNLLPPFLWRMASAGVDCSSLYLEAGRALYRAGELSALANACHDAMQTCEPSAALLELAAIGQARQGRLGAARELFASAVRLGPTDAVLLANVSYFLTENAQIADAILLAQRATQVSPHSALAITALANALSKGYRLYDAVSACRQGLALPHLTLEERSNLLHSLAGSLISAGKLQQGVEASEAATALIENAAAASCHAFANLYRDDITGDVLAHQHRSAGQLYLEQFARHRRTSWSNRPIPNRRLRIGLLSSDLCHHPVGLLLVSWVAHVDQAQFELNFYSTTMHSDRITQQLQSSAARWRDCGRYREEEIADFVEADEIDILIDLNGHTQGNRLGVFAIKPAPVQISWAGYVFSTGLNTIDGVVHDRFSARPETDAFYVERVLRLGCMSYCYLPPDDLRSVAETPALRRGYVTFGCFNHVPKLTDTTLLLWARVLDRLPTSRLFLKAGPFADRGVADAYRNRLRALGVEDYRVRIEGPSQFEEYLAAYDEVDIALDPFPFNGGVTSLQGLWQGVPLLTRSGALHASRIGGSIMHALNMSSWVSETDDQFVAAAEAKTLDFENLNRIRTRMRERLTGSTIGNGKLFAARMEQLWRECWYGYCRQSNASHTPKV